MYSSNNLSSFVSPFLILKSTLAKTPFLKHASRNPLESKPASALINKPSSFISTEVNLVNNSSNAPQYYTSHGGFFICYLPITKLTLPIFSKS